MYFYLCRNVRPKSGGMTTSPRLRLSPRHPNRRQRDSRLRAGKAARLFPFRSVKTQRKPGQDPFPHVFPQPDAMGTYPCPLSLGLQSGRDMAHTGSKQQTPPAPASGGGTRQVPCYLRLSYPCPAKFEAPRGRDAVRWRAQDGTESLEPAFGRGVESCQWVLRLSSD